MRLFVTVDSRNKIGGHGVISSSWFGCSEQAQIRCHGGGALILVITAILQVASRRFGRCLAILLVKQAVENEATLNNKARRKYTSVQREVLVCCYDRKWGSK